MKSYLLLTVLLAAACCTNSVQVEGEPTPPPKLSVEELTKRTSEIKAAQPEAHRELIKLYRHGKNFAKFISGKGGYNNEPLLAADAGYLLLHAERDLNFDTARVCKEYSHLAEIAGFVGYLKGEDNAPKLVCSRNNGKYFQLSYESDGQLKEEQFDAEQPARSCKVQRRGGKYYLIYTWFVRGNREDENEYKKTQYVLIENHQFKVEKTKSKIIP